MPFGASGAAGGYGIPFDCAQGRLRFAQDDNFQGGGELALPISPTD